MRAGVAGLGLVACGSMPRVTEGPRHVAEAPALVVVPVPDPGGGAVTPRPDPRLAEAIAPLFERVLPSRWGSRQPLVGADGRIVVGDLVWDRAGRYVGRNQLDRGGSLDPVGMVGDRVMSLGWDALYDGGEPGWLVVGDVAQPIEAATHFGVAATYDPLGNEAAVSPGATRVALVEGARVVIRDLASGAELAAAPHAAAVDGARGPRVCWATEARIAWHDGDAGWTTLDASRGANAVRMSWPATAALACDAAGGAAAVTIPTGVATIELSTGARIGELVVAGVPSAVAVADHGHRIGVAAGPHVSIAVLPRGASQFTSAWHHVWNTDSNAPPRQDDEILPPDWNDFFQLSFSPDATRLAIVGSTLLVVGPASDARPVAPAPALTIELPKGFTQGGPDDQIAWPRLAAPSGALPLPARLLHAQARGPSWAEVTITAIDADELRDRLPSATASTAEVAAFGRLALQRISAHWASIGDDTAIPAPSPRAHDAEFTLAAGRTETAAFADGRELSRDGCEPYDGYTRVVFDRDRGIVVVVQATTTPGSSIAGWLAVFLDAPFHLKPARERRRGPSSGPC